MSLVTASVYKEKANSAYLSGDLAGALSIAKKAVVAHTQDAQLYNFMGCMLGASSLPHQAFRVFELAVRLSPLDSHSISNFGLAALSLGASDTAKTGLERGFVFCPGEALILNALGMVHARLHASSTAVEHFRRSLEVTRELQEANSNLSGSLNEIGSYDDALEYSARALVFKPDSFEPLNNRALSFRGLGMIAAGSSVAARAEALAPFDWRAANTRSVLCSESGRFEEALVGYRRALCLSPDSVEARSNKGFMELIHRNYRSGWRDYHYRWQVPQFNSLGKRFFSKPCLQPGDSITGKVILVHHEQGIGDTIQFCRYISLFRKSGARVILLVPKSLKRLFKAQEAFGQVISIGEPDPAFDMHCPFMSLPVVFGTTLESIPFSREQFLRPISSDVVHWKEYLNREFMRHGSDGAQLRVGLVWSGGSRPDEPETWAANQRRNVPLLLLSAALDLPGIDFVSLQKGEPAESEFRGREGAYWKVGRVFNAAADLKDFADTAGLIANLDLVISVDTSTAHLAAAMGKPTWILNRYDTCWRWLLDREDSPWYASVRLYRQGADRDWNAVLKRVTADLIKTRDLN